MIVTMVLAPPRRRPRLGRAGPDHAHCGHRRRCRHPPVRGGGTRHRRHGAPRSSPITAGYWYVACSSTTPSTRVVPGQHPS